MKTKTKKSSKPVFILTLALATAMYSGPMFGAKDDSQPECLLQTIGKQLDPLLPTVYAAANSFFLGYAQAHHDKEGTFETVPWLSELLFSCGGYGCIISTCLSLQPKALYPVTFVAGILGYLWGRFGNPFCAETGK